MTASLLTKIEEVVRSGNCSGCGACLLLDSGLRLELDENGFARPVQREPSAAVPNADATFAASCPGRVVRAQRPLGSDRHPTMGPVVASWRAWAGDPELRRAGSSGGALTALAAWLSETGRAARVIGTAPATDARRTIPIAITSRDQALASAGSRYAPVTGAMPAAGGATIGTPCRISALRAMGPPHDEILLSFLCAGTPSQLATDQLAAELGVTGSADQLRYRGNGWPGRFEVQGADGSGSMSYEQSWGERLGRQVHPRCKICPDGVGESADITAADLWEADDRGYPTFADADGVSALAARTVRGYELVLAAAAAGVLVIHPLRVEHLAAVQPLHEERRQTLAGRLVGALLAGRRVPRYRGFRLVRLALPRWRHSVRAARGTFRRIRQAT